MNRIDYILVNKKLVSGREKAKELIKNNQVYVNDALVTKPSQIFDDDIDIKIIGETLKYVGRGGLKLEKALSYFNLNLKDKRCIDIGASTGGFTECMLLNGADMVYAVDVGHDQLAEKLKNDNRVVNMEGTNIKVLSKEMINDDISFISIDVSFISLTKVLPKAYELSNENAIIVALIKPQFEAGKQNVGKHGIVKSSIAHKKILCAIAEYANTINLSMNDITFSPVQGSDGNIEYLALFTKTNYNNIINFDSIVDDAFNYFKK